MYSTSGSTLTIQLPAASQITSNVLARIRASFDFSKGTRYHVMIPVTSTKPNILTCFEITAGWVPSGRNYEDTYCYISTEHAKALTENQSITVTAGTSTGNRTLTLVVRPYSGPNYVAAPLTLVTSGNRPNDLITFRVKLMSPAASSTQVAWGLSPVGCFVQDSPGTTYSSGWTLSNPNVVTFATGAQQLDLTVRIANDGTCVGANRKLEVWNPPTTSVMQSPAYNTLYFTINALKKQ